MPSSEYPEAVLEYVQAQGWTTNITELREGAYIVAGTREADSSPKKMLLMIVCEPENKVTSEHVEYLVNAGREKNVDSVLLTHTVGITEKAREIGKEYGIGVIDSKKVRSHAESSNFDVDTDEIQMPEAESESQADLSSNSNLEERAKQIVEQAEGSAITKELLLGQESSSDEAKQVLADQPLIEYLYENESPNYIFWSDLRAFSLPNQNLDPASDFRAVCVISNERVLLVVGTKEGDQVVSIPYDAISTAEVSTGIMKHRLTITPDDNDSGDYDLYIAQDAVESEDELEKSSEYISNMLSSAIGNRSINKNVRNQSNTESDVDVSLTDGLFEIFLIIGILVNVVAFVIPGVSPPVSNSWDEVRSWFSDSDDLDPDDLDPEEVKNNASEISADELFENEDRYQGAYVHFPEAEVLMTTDSRMSVNTEPDTVRVGEGVGEERRITTITVKCDTEDIEEGDRVEIWGQFEEVVSRELVDSNEEIPVPIITCAAVESV
jgi:hypothetical protein